MDKILNTCDFSLNDEKKELFGILFDHDPTLLGYRFTSNKFPEIEGIVYKYFHTSEYTVLSVKGYEDKPLGTFFGVILITKGWDLIKAEKAISFTLEPNLNESIVLNPNRELKPGEIYVKFRRMNKPHELSSFYVDVRGGSTDGSGRNEHRMPHFHLLKKKSREELAKIFFPAIEIWNKASNKIDLLNIESGSLTKSEKKEITSWLEKDDNLLRLHAEWTESNKFNNRILEEKKNS